MTPSRPVFCPPPSTTNPPASTRFPKRTLRIAFIAMSGLRACDPELTALDLTLPGFVERGRSIVLGLDGQTTRVFDQVLGFVADALPFDVQVTVPTPFPGTPFHDQLRREGRLLAEHAWERCTLFDVNFQPTHMSARELAAGLRRMVVALYGEEATARRRQHFKNRSMSEKKADYRFPLGS